MDIYTRQLTELWDSDVIVVGAGSAGVTAAIAAARNGAHDVGGALWLSWWDQHPGARYLLWLLYTGFARAYKVVGGIPDDVVAGLKQHNAAFERPNSFGAGTGVTYDPTLLKIVWETLALEAGVRLLLHSFCTDVIMEGDRIAGVIVDGKRGLLS
ncbi:MAG: FAD-dependent oxidoreductase [Caldilineaceae bacterium]